jgi:hypothetical protein
MLELHATLMGQQVRDRAAFLAEDGPIHNLTGRPMRRCPGCGRWSGIVGIGAAVCFSCSAPEPCPDCDTPWRNATEAMSAFAGRYRNTLVDYEGVRVTLADAVALDRDKVLYGNAYIRRLPGGRGERIPPGEIRPA